MKYNFTKEELEEKIKEFLSVHQVSLYYNCPSNIIQYYLHKYEIKPLLCGHAKDERGNQYGYLTVTDFAGRNDRGEILWTCKCKCGNIVTRSGVELRRQRNFPMCEECHRKKVSEYRTIDRIGEKINKLTILKKIGTNNSGNIEYLCQCECGNQIVVNSGRIATQISCGCINSKGEFFINQILSQNGIKYKTQYSFKDCRNSKTGHVYYFDFCILDSDDNVQYLIEYNGRQHYKKAGIWEEDAPLEERQRRDQEKIDYCKNKKIPLLIIPYQYDTKEKIEAFIKEQISLKDGNPLSLIDTFFNLI